jgi:hypothetical protein
LAIHSFFMMMLFFALALLLGVSRATTMLKIDYAYIYDTSYMPQLLPTCDWPRSWANVSLPFCDGFRTMVYQEQNDELINWGWCGQHDNCHNYYPCLPTAVPQDVCTDAWGGSWSFFHIHRNASKRTVLRDQHYTWEDWQTGPDVGRNITLQTFNWTTCKHPGPMIHAEIGKCYKQKYYGSYALVGFRNSTVLTGMSWTNVPDCKGVNNQWFYIVQNQCSQPTYSYADGPSSWMGYWW